jgi:hypothetical protein
VSVIAELKRRNVIRVAVVYGLAAWLILQVADVLVPSLGLPATAQRFVALLLILGFPLVLIFAWVYELTPDGLKKQHEVDRSQSITVCGSAIWRRPWATRSPGTGSAPPSSSRGCVPA